MAKTILVVGEAGYSSFFKQVLADRGYDDVDVVDVDLLRHRVQALERQNKRLLEAIRPFAIEFEEWNCEEGAVYIRDEDDHECDVAVFRVEDLKRAHELVTKHL